jgi:hypothetical protein
VAIVISPEEFQRLNGAAVAPKVNPLVARLHTESVERWHKVYEALAK